MLHCYYTKPQWKKMILIFLVQWGNVYGTSALKPHHSAIYYCKLLCGCSLSLLSRIYAPVFITQT